MESGTETSFETATQDLSEMNLSLDKLIGKDWQNKVFKKTIEDSIGKNMYSGYLQRIDIDTKKSESLDKENVLANIINNKNLEYTVQTFVSAEGDERIVLEKKIERDKFIQIINPESIKIITIDKGQVVDWSVEKALLVGEKGLMDITQIFDLNTTIQFFETNNVVYRENNKGVSTHKTGKDYIRTPLPSSIDEFSNLFHEFGHNLRTKYFESMGNTHSLVEHVARKEFKAGRPEKLSNFETRNLVSGDERGAWAIAISLLKEGRHNVGIFSESKSIIDSIYKRSQDALETYDNHEYLHDDDNLLVPVFTNEQRKNAKMLEEIAKQNNISLRDIPFHYKYDLVANNPKRIIELLDSDQNFRLEVNSNRAKRVAKEIQKQQAQYSKELKAYGLNDDMIPKKDLEGNEHGGDRTKILEMMKNELYLSLAQRRLKEIMEERGIKKENLPKFDTDTGLNIEKDPRRQIQIILYG